MSFRDLSLKFSSLLKKSFPVVLTAVLIPPALSDETDLACDGKYQDKQVRFIVSYKPGGGYDAYARMIAPHFADALGAKSLVENWTGGKGLIALNKILSASPDDITVGLISVAGTALLKLSGEQRAPDIVDDFAHLGRVVRIPSVAVTTPDSQVQSFDDMTNLDPPAVTAASGLTSTGGLTVAVFQRFLDLPVQLITGMGSTRDRIPALLRGDIDFFTVPFSSVRTHVESGEMKVIMQLSDTPVDSHPALQDVPLLLGKDGWAAQRLEQIGAPADRLADIEAIFEPLYLIGRIVVGSGRWSEEKTACLSETLLTVLESPELQAASAKLQLPLHPAPADEAIAPLADGLDALTRYWSQLQPK